MEHALIVRSPCCVATWLIHMCAIHSYVWHHTFIHVPWRIYIRDMTHPYVKHDSFIYERFHWKRYTSKIHQIWWADER